MNHRQINPWPWSLQFGFSQGILTENPTRQLQCSGQTATDADGKTVHVGDMRAQFDVTLTNLEAVLERADMGFQNVIRIGVFTTDVDELIKNFDLLAQRLAPLQIAPAMTLLGVGRLAMPEALVEVEATAAD